MSIATPGYSIPVFNFINEEVDTLNEHPSVYGSPFITSHDYKHVYFRLTTSEKEMEIILKDLQYGAEIRRLKCKMMEQSGLTWRSGKCMLIEYTILCYDPCQVHECGVTCSP
jgi:hypothetical protein